MLEPADFNNTYAIAVRREAADEYGIETLEDLAEASPNLVFASFSEFQERGDGFPNIQENYDVNFEDIQIVNSLGNRYQALAQGDADVAVASPPTASSTPTIWWSPRTKRRSGPTTTRPRSSAAKSSTRTPKPERS